MYTTAFATSYHGVWLANSNSSQRSVPFCNRQQRCTVAKQRTVMMGLRAVENFDGSFVLDPTVREKLEACLKADKFVEYVAGKGNCESSEFTGILFQPVPYSKSTPRGMPADVEPYAADGHYMIINVPPKVMFDARCFKPPRLCAVFKRIGVSEEDLAQHAEKETTRAASVAERSKQLEDDLWTGLGSVIKENFHRKDDQGDSDLDAMVV